MALSLTFVNQVGAPDGLNQAAPGSFIPESFVRWAQDVLFDRVGYLRRRKPYTTLELYNASGSSISQLGTSGERVLGLITTRNPNNENRIGIVVTDGLSTRVLFYDNQYHAANQSVLSVVKKDSILFSRQALNGGLFIGLLENYNVDANSTKNLLYYWRGGTGLEHTVNSCTLGVTNNESTTGSADVSNDKITKANHGYANGYPIIFSDIKTVTGISTNTIYYIVSAATNDFQIALTVGGTPINLTGADAIVTFTIGAHATYTNRITGSFDTSKLSPGMFVYRKVSDTEDRYLGVLKSWEPSGAYIDLEKDCIRTYGYKASPLDPANTSANIKFVNVRPYIHCHGRGLINKTAHGLSVTSGTIGSDGEGHFAAADLGGASSGIKWALYRASDGEWLGDIDSAPNNTTLTLDNAYHTDIIAMNADEYVARPYRAVPKPGVDTDYNAATKYTGVFNTTYAGYQWFANGGIVGTENRIVFSAYNDPEAVDLSKDAADSILVPGTQQLRGIATSLSGLLIFLEDKTYILRGNYRSNFSLEELYPDGCLSGQSIVEYGGGVFWASKNGILFYDGASVRNLTQDNLGAYYTDGIKNFDAASNRIYGFFYKDYLFMTFTGFVPSYTPLRYEPLYADTLDTSPEGLTKEQIQALDPSFTNEDFDVQNNVPIYWKTYQMYASTGTGFNKYTDFWGEPGDARFWGESPQFVWGPVNSIENITFAIYLPTNAITTISNFDFRGFIKLDSAGGTRGFVGINAVNPDNLEGVYPRIIDVDSMLSPVNDHDEVLDSELSENPGKQAALYYKGPDFFVQTKHYPVGDPVVKKWFRQVMLNLYLLDGAVRMDIVDNEDNDSIDITKKRQRNWALIGEKAYTWDYWQSRVLNTLASPKQPTWDTVNTLGVSWYNVSNAEFSLRKKKISWRYPSVGFRLYQMNSYRPANYQNTQRPHTIMLDSWNFGFKPMRQSRM